MPALRRLAGTDQRLFHALASCNAYVYHQSLALLARKKEYCTLSCLMRFSSNSSAACSSRFRAYGPSPAGTCPGLFPSQDVNCRLAFESILPASSNASLSACREADSIIFTLFLHYQRTGRELKKQSLPHDKDSCPKGDSDPHPFYRLVPETSASTSSAIRASTNEYTSPAAICQQAI